MRRLLLAALLLALPACTGDGGEAPAEDPRALPTPSVSGACAPLQTDLAALAAIAPGLGESGDLAPEDAQELELLQSGLASAAADLPEELSTPVDTLVTRIGLVRLAGEAGRLEAASADDLREGYQGVLDACAAQ